MANGYQQVSESRIVANIMTRLKKQPGLYGFKVHGGPMQALGIPDIVLCYQGRFGGLEVKRPGQKPTAIQQATLDRIRECGGIAAVVTSVDEALEALGITGE
jgi:hypothetical protein